MSTRKTSLVVDVIVYLVTVIGCFGWLYIWVAGWENIAK